MRPEVVLAADVGGTHCRLAVCRVHAAPPGAEILWSDVLTSAPDMDLGDALREAVSRSGLGPRVACLGVPGPVRDGRCVTTNLPWRLDERDLARASGLERVTLVNDLEAAARGLAWLPPSALVTLNAGAPEPRGNRALIAAGTGLGEAGLAADGARWIPFATEGGHATFAPADDEQEALARRLRAKHGHVSWERLVSGPGLVAIHEHLAERDGGASPEVRERLARGEGGAVVTEAALAGDPVAARSVELFVRLYGAEAGNLALKLLATGGVFVGGGIAPRLRRWMEGPLFLEAFLGKGRMRPLLESMPVRLVVDDRLGLIGAAAHAAGAG